MISEERREDWRWGLVWAALAVVTLLALHRLRDFPVQPRFSDAWHGVSQVFPATAWAAVKVWSFWLIASSVLGGIALRLDNEIDPSDALLIGAGGAWAVADVLGFTLGPIGLFNGITIWGLLLVGGAWLWRNPPRIRFSPPTPGQTLAIVAVALLAVSYFALQLASPVPPFMDVLSYPSSVQRILTFGVYLPFDNDPYGCWGPWAQTPGLELFYAMIGASTRTIAVLAETAAMLPMAALMIFASYRLGKALFNDTVGGIAGLLLFFTCLFRRAQGMRGTAVDFALLALGLAFFLDRSRRRVFLGAGAAMLGAAFLSHAIDGGLAMIVAGAGVVMWLVEGDLRRFIAGVFALAGATLLTLPEFAIALAHPVPSAFLAATVIAGFLVIAGAAWMLKPTSKTLNDTRLSVMNVALLALFVSAALYRHATQGYSIYANVADDLPFLFLLCFMGLVISIQFSTDRPMLMRYTGLVAVALLLGVAGEYLDPIMRALSHTK
ncbi:MAG TPA: hypothetical protein VGR40_08045, partial [Candidatus Binatus sp.]|nr:hypothetical protein [Candidatus Binatus sp.]